MRVTIFHAPALSALPSRPAPRQPRVQQKPDIRAFIYRVARAAVISKMKLNDIWVLLVRQEFLQRKPYLPASRLMAVFKN
jgi:hypothetical protein